MKKIITIVASVVMMLGLASMSIMPASAATADICKDVTGTELTACAVCAAENNTNTWVDGKCNRGSGNDLNSIIQTVINVMLFIIGILCVIMIIFGGIRYTTSTGDKGRIDNAKNTIVYAVVGLIVAIVAFALVQWVFNALK